MPLERWSDGVEGCLRRQGRLIRLPTGCPVVFVGDTHGDLDATERVFERYPPSDHLIVFTGDVVDRGPDSEGNLERILREKRAHSEHVFLLMGNHEAWAVRPFAPADFWEGLPEERRMRLGTLLAGLPYAAWHDAGVLAVHGALPGVESIGEIAAVAPGTFDWRRMTWGDWVDLPGDVIDPGIGGRPLLGRGAFDAAAERLGIRVLVRSHQPDAPTYLFEDRCLTLFTSHAYGDGIRRVALLADGGIVRSARDLRLEEV